MVAEVIPEARGQFRVGQPFLLPQSMKQRRLATIKAQPFHQFVHAVVMQARNCS